MDPMAFASAIKRPNMDQLLNTLVRIREQTLAQLKALEGTYWHEASGELHLQYKEMPNWITIDEDAELRAAHAAFIAIFEPHVDALGDVNITVAYNTKPRGKGVQRAFFDTTDDIRRALTDPDFGKA